MPDHGFASIGYGLSERDGSSLSAPDRAVVAIGDGGGFNVMLGEIETARRVGRGLNPRNT